MDRKIEPSEFEGVLTIIFEVAVIMTKKRKGKNKRVKASSPGQIDTTVDAPSADKPESDENLIYVGGNALYHEAKEKGKCPTKSFKEFREQGNLSLLSEKKVQGRRRGKDQEQNQWIIVAIKFEISKITTPFGKVLSKKPG